MTDPDTVIVDPQLLDLHTPAATPGRRFFTVDDGGADYWIVARDLEHAKELLRTAGVEFTDEDGDDGPIDDPRFAALEWEEIDAERASRVNTTDEGRNSIPLSQRELGDWFCSEW